MKEGMSGTIYLAMVEGRAPYLTARWIAGFREEFPLVRYSLWNGSGDDVLDRLRKGLADLAVIAAPYDTEHLAGFPAGREPWVAIIPRSHPLAQPPASARPLARLVGRPLLWFRKRGPGGTRRHSSAGEPARSERVVSGDHGVQLGQQEASRPQGLTEMALWGEKRRAVGLGAFRTRKGHADSAEHPASSPRSRWGAPDFGTRPPL